MILQNRTVGAAFAIVSGLLGLAYALTAPMFDTSTEGVLPRDDQRYVPATFAMRIAVGVCAATMIIFGVWLLLK